MKTEPIESLRAMANDFKYNTGVVQSNIKLLIEESFISGVKYGQSSPKIKQLEWVEDYGCIMAETPFLKYLVLIIGGKAGLCFDGADEFLKFRTVDEAKAAAQRDFEKRINECFE